MNNQTEQESLDIFWMQRALELAKRAESEGEVPVGLYSDYILQVAIGYQAVIKP